MLISIFEVIYYGALVFLSVMSIIFLALSIRAVFDYIVQEVKSVPAKRR